MTTVSEAEVIAGGELLARFILQSSHIRQDHTVKPDAFIPHPYPDLSVTRHLELSEAQIWAIAVEVARSIPKTLYGRADIRAHVFRSQGLEVIAAPVPKNPNHSNVIGWPAGKPAQKIVAQQIAASAGFREAPANSV